MGETRRVAEGLVFGEGLRWRDGRLYLSDLHDRKVLALAPGGALEELARVEARPSGLGWLPDGRLLVVSMRDRRLLRLEAGRLVLHADLSGLASFDCNDMVVGPSGRAYVGNFGFDLFAGAAQRAAELVAVEPDGRARVVARDLAFPNGMVLTPDGRTLVVAESFGARLTAFDVADDGDLSRRRVWAEIEGMVPDGIALDAEGAIWVTSPASGELLRVHPGGRVSARVQPEQPPYACALGGPGRRTLYVATAPSHQPEEALARRAGCIEVLDAPAPAAGWP
jgi:sugar lactone lactonase YvrE